MVSVIIPNYCHAPYLRQRIDSVLAQSYSDFEVVLLDDCSTDGSREVIERYRNHPRIKQIVYNDRNGGSAFANGARGSRSRKESTSGSPRATTTPIRRSSNAAWRSSMPIPRAYWPTR